jgi:hypothetical protein
MVVTDSSVVISFPPGQVRDAGRVGSILDGAIFGITSMQERRRVFQEEQS